MATIVLVAVLLAVGGPPASADNLTDNHGGDGNQEWQSPVPQTDPPTPEPTPLSATWEPLESPRLTC